MRRCSSCRKLMRRTGSGLGGCSCAASTTSVTSAPSVGVVLGQAGERVVEVRQRGASRALRIGVGRELLVGSAREVLAARARRSPGSDARNARSAPSATSPAERPRAGRRAWPGAEADRGRGGAVSRDVVGGHVEAVRDLADQLVAHSGAVRVRRRSSCRASSRALSLPAGVSRSASASTRRT